VYATAFNWYGIGIIDNISIVPAVLPESCQRSPGDGLWNRNGVRLISTTSRDRLVAARVSTLNVSKFGIDPARGFLPPSDPRIQFGEGVNSYFKDLERIGQQIPELLESHKIRGRLEKLPIPDPAVLMGLSGQEVTVASRIYAFLASAYVHQIGEPAVKTLPKSVAFPFSILSTRMGRKMPILSYDLYCLNNWRRLDLSGPIKLENLDTIQKFVRIHDEPWFILVHTEIESEASPAISATGQIQQAVLDDSDEHLQEGLETIGKSLTNMILTLRRMPEGNSPDVYAFAFRPYIQMFGEITYEGVEGLAGPQTLRGETGAQSSIIPSLDVALGIRHRRTDLTDYVGDMRNYMPSGHRSFIEAIAREEKARPLRNHVVVAGSRSLAEAYNTCLERIGEFRQQHLEFATSYIQTKVADENGTGGTPFMKWLAQLRSETQAAMVAF
jgi:indoleamine 2,3-dioxygenase